ncbi:MAG: leucine-rich repeat domain-containing protein [Bacteroidales bacterium]|nr:leucine-rich repeat domain-containing protein [Bacteroidales bacterium]
MKKLVITLIMMLGLIVQAWAYDFQSGNLLYTIISTDPPCVSLDGHIDGENAQGELVIPETVTYEGVAYVVTEIGHLAFRRCSSLEGVLEIPETVRIIGEQAFYNCTGLTGLVLSEGLFEIREFAFGNCTGLTGTLDFPATMTHIKYGAFANCAGFSGDLVLPNSVVEVGNTIYPGYLNMPEPVSTFADCFNHLVLSQALDTIGPRCFQGCTHLTGDLVMPEGLKAIYEYAFEGCYGLTGLTLNDSLSIIGSFAFSYCIGITGTLTLPENINVGPHAFEWCMGVEALNLPHHIVFSDNPSRGYVFQGCMGLTELDVPEGWTTVEQSNFRSCSNLIHVRLPESLTSIGSSAFQDCRSLEDINIPDGVVEINSAAFSYCRSLTHIELPAHLRTLAGLTFARCTSLTGEVVIPDLVQRIDLNTFDSCYMLSRIVFGDSINYITEPAFENTNLSSLVLKTTTPPELRRKTTQGAWHFPADIPIIVPCGALEAYQNDENWSSFTNITEDCGNGLVGFSGAEWYYEILNLNGTITYQHLEYAADTTVNHKNVQIIIRTNTLYDKSEHVEVTREYVYEEDGVVYWWNKDLQEFSVLYDYNAVVGSEWEIKVGVESIAMHVDAVEQYYYDGRLYRMLRVSDAEDLFSGTIVCGIGHLSSFFPEKLMTRGKGYRVEGMRCFWRNGELVFKYGEEDCDAVYKDYHFGLDEQKATAFAIYPNPTHGVLFVRTQALRPYEEYRITNLMGQTLMTGNINEETQQIDVTNLPQGMYFISVGEGTRKFVVR